jgi:hypothetical protein
MSNQVFSRLSGIAAWLTLASVKQPYQNLTLPSKSKQPTMCNQSTPNPPEKIEFYSTLTSFFPFAVAFILFISTARLFLIYQQFHLPIFAYLEFSDLTIGIVNDLYGFIWFLLASILLFCAIDLVKKVANKIGGPIGLALFLVIAAIIAYIYWVKRIETFSTHFIVCWIIYIDLCLGAFVIKCGHRSRHNRLSFLKRVDNKTMIFSMIFIFSFLFCKSLSSYSVHVIKAGGSKGSIVKFKDSVRFVSNDSIYYIGNTTKFLFIYNSKQNSCSSFPMTNVDFVTTVP